MNPSPSHQVVAISVLGSFRLTCGRTIRRLRPSTERLVGLLAVAGEKRRSRAASLLWPDANQDRSQANLRTTLWRLRSDHPGLVLEDGDLVELPDDVSVDLRTVRHWSSSALQANSVSYDSPPDGAASDLLPTWDEDRLIEPRHEFRLLQLHALESSAQRLLISGRLGEAALCALKAVALDPLRESANRLLIEVYLLEGNQVDALRQYRQFEALLAREIGIKPGRALLALLGSYFDVRLASPPRRTSPSLDRVGWQAARRWRSGPS
jgi:DNA-binding SARP family transcriptional activator